MLLLVVALNLVAPAPAASASPSTATSSEDPLADARTMYKRGSAKFSAADYNGAIDTWTELLSTLPDGAEFDAIRLDLLFNIALAHEREHTLDHDARHLRQALTLFRSYAEANNDKSVEEHIARIEGKLAALKTDAEPNNAGTDDPQPAQAESGDTQPRDQSAPRNLKGLGIGMLAGGGAVLGGGVALLIAGSRLKPKAEEQIQILDDRNVPADHSSRIQANEFLTSETTRGRGLMAGGGVAMGIGAAAVGVGVWALVRTKKDRSARAASLTLTPVRGGFSLGGRF